MFRGLNEIKQHIEEGNLDYLRQHMPKAWSQYMFRIEKDPAGLEIISYLRANAVIKDYQIYYLMYCRVAYYSEPKQFTPLFDIIKVNGPDGSLVEETLNIFTGCVTMYISVLLARLFQWVAAWTITGCWHWSSQESLTLTPFLIFYCPDTPSPMRHWLRRRPVCFTMNTI